jgi:hypothetical protein
MLARILSRFLAAGALVLAIPSAVAQDTVSLRLNWQILGFHAPFYLGVERGFYREAGINLTVNEGRGGAVTAQAIGAKSDQFGIVDGGTTIVSAVRGIPIRTVMSLMNSGIFAVVARADANIRTAKDLEGKSIAVTAGDALTQLWPAVVRVNKLDPSRIRLVNVDPAGKVIATLEKRTDALLGSIDAQSFQIEAKGVKTSMLSYDDGGRSRRHDQVQPGPDQAVCERNTALIRGGHGRSAGGSAGSDEDQTRAGSQFTQAADGRFTVQVRVAQHQGACDGCRLRSRLEVDAGTADRIPGDQDRPRPRFLLHKRLHAIGGDTAQAEPS